MKAYITQGWQYKREEVEHSMRRYRPIGIKLVMMDGIAMKRKRIMIPFQFQKQILQQLYRNHVGMN